MTTAGSFRFSEQEGMKEGEKEKSLYTPSTRLVRPMVTQHDDSTGITFRVAIFFSQVIGLACIGMVIYWCRLYGGFAWTSNADKQFYWHPFLMVFGLIFFYGDSIIIYRALSFLPKRILKVLHGAFHVLAIILSSVGLVAVLENHRRTNKGDFYSLHSWVGIGTFALFCLQYIAGFIVFLFPGLPLSLRARILPFHTFFGIVLFVLAIGTAEMGLTEKLLWTPQYTNTTTPLPVAGVVGNTLGLGLIIFGVLIIFIVTHEAYRRKPLPSEVPPDISKTST